MFDLVDYVTMVSEMVGKKVGVSTPKRRRARYFLTPTSGVSQVVPQRIQEGREGFLFLRSQHGFRDAHLVFSFQDKIFQTMELPLCYPSEMIKINLQDINWPSGEGEIQIGIKGEKIRGIR